MQRNQASDAERAVAAGAPRAYAADHLLPAVFRERACPAKSIASGFSQMKLGEILVSLGVIDGEDRDFALQRQGDLDILFGECCLRLRLISGAELSWALARQFDAVHAPLVSSRYGRDLVTMTAPSGPYAETLRALAGRLMSNVLLGGRKALAVSSAEPGEGRSHLAANLAVSFACAGYRTLLLDADFRHPKQHENFGIRQFPGLSRLLCGYTPEDVVRQVPFVENLSLVTAGPLPPNPSELLGRGQLAGLIEEAKAHYDVILVDTPAGDRFPDAELVAPAVDAVLMVARKNRTRERQLKAFADRLAATGAFFAGTLMTDH
ncbi:polysaccharide biosynthesis tyrosine autokinase [Thiorhodococcus minor]|uniref:Polysaccharide biosynthesis tyrosine autokinase n=1 Tax=Thiorhodococcus minor TaxID=57489 RepID=A0A6M0JZU7_9GAMM|nr:polysaccharide biosynthesis tyrosine autokinase [Thiorhodococcus minor]NEV62203.1 polysaccharide biosynthesis tyrosine autokinase [Thiorhodococcus minor]